MTYTLVNAGEQTKTDNVQRGFKLCYDEKSFIIGEERVFLNSASIHYFRMPRQEWREERRACFFFPALVIAHDVTCLILL